MFKPDESLDFDSLVLISVSVTDDTSRSFCDTVNKNTTIKENNEMLALIFNGVVRHFEKSPFWVFLLLRDVKIYHFHLCAVNTAYS